MSPLDFALEYLRRGWSPVPVPFRGKAPLDKGWPELAITEGIARRYFNGEAQNIGIKLGEPSGGLADVDLDCAEAIAAAPYFLPRLCALAGRRSRAVIGFTNPIFGKRKTRPQFNSNSPPARAKTAKSRRSSN